MRLRRGPPHMLRSLHALQWKVPLPSEGTPPLRRYHNSHLDRYFAVASAVERIDNGIVGDIEQEKEKEGDFYAAMVMQENHLHRTVLDVTSIAKV